MEKKKRKKGERTASIRFIYSTCRMLRMFAGWEDRTPSATRRFVSYLLGAMTALCWACPLGLCWPSCPGLAVGHRALFHILMMYIPVYIVVFYLPLFFNPPLLFLFFVLLSASVYRQAAVAFILMCVVVLFIFSHKVHCNLKKKVFSTHLIF